MIVKWNNQTNATGLGGNGVDGKLAALLINQPIDKRYVRAFYASTGWGCIK